MTYSKPMMSISLYFGVAFLIYTHTSSAKEPSTSNDMDDIHNQFKVEIQTNNDEIDISWKLNVSQEIYGFKAMIYGDDNEIVYRSPVLHKTATHMTFSQELDSGENRVCVQVLANATQVLNEKCLPLEISDMKIVIGVLAGTVFLVPCLIGLSYILYKDYKFRRGEDYKDLPESEDDSDTPIDNADKATVKYILKSDATASKKVKQLGAHMNDSFVEDETVNNRNKATTQARDISNTGGPASMSKRQQVLSLDIDTTIAMAAACREKPSTVIETAEQRESKSDVYCVKL